MSRFNSRLVRKNLSYTTDSSFLEKVCQGDEESWFKFYDKYNGMVRSIGASRGLSPAECEDLMTEIMVVFWRKMDEFFYDRKRGKFRSYLGCIVHFLSLKILRQKQRREKINEHVQMFYSDYLGQSELEEWQNFLIDQALEDLKNGVDTETFQVFYMSFVQKRSVADISEITGKTANNMYVIRSRCLRKLKKQIAFYRRQEENFQGISNRNAVEI